MLKQRLQQKLQQKLSPLQIQTIKLLEVPVMQLEQKIKEELENNPVLEQVESDEEEPTTIELILKNRSTTCARKRRGIQP
jgi:RNA polymerase, sigma 54 subunit, RpoN/SigL